MKKYFLILSIVFTFIIGYSQTYDVSINGQITEIGTGIPISNQYVHISNEGSPGGTTHDNIVYTNADGYYFDTLVAPINTVGVINVTVYGCNNIYMDTESYSPNIYNLVFDFEICNDSSGAACEAYFSAAIFTGELNVQFYDESMGNPIQWLWNFGDGNTSTDQNPMHTFDEFGYHTVSLTITDTANECTSTVEQIILIDSAFPPICEADYFAMQDTNNLRKFYFYDASTVPAGQSVIWNWTFGDGNTSTEQNPVHTYAEEGDYGVCLTIQTNDFTCDSWLCDTVTAIESSNCETIFSYELDILNNVPRSYLFYDISDGNAISWLWDFGDGSFDQSQNPYHVYESPGTYNVCLSITYLNSGSYCYSDTCIQITTIDYYAFGGIAFLGDYPINIDSTVKDNIAKVSLFKKIDHNWFFMDEKEFWKYGYYWFTDKPSGEYLILAELQASSIDYDNYSPTYYPGSINWKNTETFILENNDQFSVNINFKELETHNSGMGSIEGTIFTNSSCNPLNDINIDNVIIQLLNNKNEIIAYTHTNALGYYKFENLAESSYIIKAEYPGKYSEKQSVIIDQINTSIIQNLEIHCSHILISEDFVYKYDLVISNPSPNPASIVTLINIKSNTSKNISVSILNTNGLLVYESIININEGNNTTTIPLNGLKRGLYLINILDLTTNNVEVRKIIINN